MHIAKRLYSLDVFRLGEWLYQICIILRDVPGALAKVCRVLADANVNIKTSSSFYVDEYPEAGVWSAFIDVSKANNPNPEVRCYERISG